jgi:non-ribosomal peptide synthetase component F
MTLLAAWQTLLARYTGQEDIVVGAPIAGRTHQDLEGLIGFFVNTLVLRTDLSGAPSFRDLLGRVRNVTLEAYAHQDLPFEKLVEILQPERNLNYSPLFQVFFNMLPPEHRPIPAFAEILAESFFPDEEDAKFDITLYVDPNQTSIELHLVYNTALFEADRMQELLRQFVGLIEQIVQSPDASIGAYSLLTARARQLLPDPTEVLTEPNFLPVTNELLAWAEKAPGQKAVTQKESFWTYKDLSVSAQRLACSMLAQGVQPGDVVAVTGPRCFGMICSMVSVFMSGGVLLTIDRNLPVKRQRLMLETARA